MKASIAINHERIEVDLSKPIDVSIPLRSGMQNPSAWNAPNPSFEPVRMGDWIGEVKSGAPVNFRNVFLNPHGNGTHTESVGHISKEDYFLNDCMKQFSFMAELISVEPEKLENGDFVITKDQIRRKLLLKNTSAVLIRTLPNTETKLTRQYFQKNPPFIDVEAAKFLRESGIRHLLIDLPSVDREEDQGLLAAHHAFWNYPESPLKDATITELIFVQDKIKDGRYFLNIQVASFENDASPSKILLFELI